MKKSMKVLLMVFLVALFTGIGGQKVQASDVTLKDGKWTNGTLLQTGTDQYYKIKIKKSGYIKIEYARDDELAEAAYEVYYKGKNQKVATIGMLSSGSSTSYLAVKKGTYYIHINDTAYPWDLEDIDVDGTDLVKSEAYKIRYSFKYMKEGKKVANYKKAPTLNTSESVSGLFYNKNKIQNSYYKITVSEKKKVIFDYEIMSTDSISGALDIYNENGKLLYVNNKHQVKPAGDYTTFWEGKGSDYVILDKGTYYFCFSMLKGASGYYKFKIK